MAAINMIIPGIILGGIGVLSTSYYLWKKQPWKELQERITPNSRLITFDRVYPGRTIGRKFKVQYRLSGTILKINDEAFKKARMSTPANQQQLVAEFHEREVLSRLDSSYFFTGCWSKAEEGAGMTPALDLCRIRHRERTGVKVIPAGQELGDALEHVGFQAKGCHFAYLHFRTKMDEALIEENYSMLTPEERADVNRHSEYLAYEEMVAIAAMKRRLEIFKELRQLVQERCHDTPGLWVEVKTVDCAARISWRIKEPGWTVQGYRKEGEFSKDAGSTTANGALVISSSQDGRDVQSLEEGKTYFYTLFLQKGSKKNSSIRFSLTMPDRKQIERFDQLARLIERAAARQPAPPSDGRPSAG